MDYTGSWHSFDKDLFHEVFTKRCEKTRIRDEGIFGVSRENRGSLNPVSTRHTLQMPML